MNSLNFESLAVGLIDCLHSHDLTFAELVKLDEQHDLGRVFSVLRPRGVSDEHMPDTQAWHIVSTVPDELLKQLKPSAHSVDTLTPEVTADVRAGRIGIHYMLIRLRWRNWEHRLLIPIASNDVAQLIAQFREHGVVCALTNTPIYGLKNRDVDGIENIDAVFLRISPTCMSERLKLLAQAVNQYDDDLYPARLVATESLIVAIQALELPGAVSSAVPRRVTVSVACHQLQAELDEMGVLDNGRAT